MGNPNVAERLVLGEHTVCEVGAVAITDGDRTSWAAPPSFRADRCSYVCQVFRIGNSGFFCCLSGMAGRAFAGLRTRQGWATRAGSYEVTPGRSASGVRGRPTDR